MSVRIISYPNNYRVKKSLIASQYNGVHIEQPAFDMSKGEHKTPQFVAVNPFGQVPTAFASDTEGVFESASILRYVARLGEAKHPLYGKNPLESSRIDAFLDLALGLEGHFAPWIYPILGYMQLNETARSDAQERIKKILAGLNAHLHGKDFLVGGAVSIADIGFTCSLLNGYTMVFEKEYIGPFPEVTRYFRQNISRPEFKAVLGDLVLAMDK